MSCVKSTVAAILQAARLKAQYGAVLTAPEGPAEMDVDKHACDPIEIRDLKDWVEGRFWRRWEGDGSEPTSPTS